jgi:hypothetical protein
LRYWKSRRFHLEGGKPCNQNALHCSEEQTAVMRQHQQMKQTVVVAEAEEAGEVPAY